VLPIYQSAILAILLFTSGSRESCCSKLIMGAFLSTTGIYFSFNLLYSLSSFDLLKKLYFLILPIILAFIPLFYLYLESITTPGFHFRKKQLWHFLPAAIFFILMSPYFFATEHEKYLYINHDFIRPGMSPVILYLLIVYISGTYLVSNLQLGYYVYRSLQLFHRHKIYIVNRFSYTENIHLDWIKSLIFCFVVFFLINELLYITGIKQHLFSGIFYNVSMLGVILFAGYHGMEQKNLEKEEKEETEIQAEISAEVPEKIKYSGSSLTVAQKKALIAKLELLILDEKIYTNKELSIEDVAQRLETNSKYISQILNEHYQKNFFTYINTYRVEEAQRLLSSDKTRKYSILGIAQMAGFTSKSSFYEAFKNITGTTPNEFRKKLKC
jgi:AraC-like DNA-binding protein